MLPKEKALEIIERTGLTDIVEKTFMQLPCSGISGVAKCTLSLDEGKIYYYFIPQGEVDVETENENKEH